MPNFIPLWSEKILDIIYILLYLLRLFLLPSMWSLLENIPFALENNVYFAVLRWNVLLISTNSNWSNVSFKAIVSLLIFYLEDLSININEVLMSLLLLYYCHFLPLCLLIFALLNSPILGAYMFRNVISSSCFDFIIIT